jgi:hypothetical protein
VNQGRGRAGRALVAVLLVGGAAVASPQRASAQAPPPRAVVDRAVVRFYAPETGGTAHPRFIDERTLAFEARLEALAEGAATAQAADGYPERQVRSALEHDITEELLAGLARKLIDGSPPTKRPDAAELASIGDDLAEAWYERLGGRARVDAAASAEGLDPTEIDAILARQALAAWYLDRAVTPVLKPSEEQLRDVFRSSAQPYVGRSFEDVRPALSRWFVLQRVRLAESTFYQAARAHVVLVVTR